MKNACLWFVFVNAVVCFAQQGWFPHEGGLLKYKVQIRFGEEPDTMPDGWKFGRVSAVAVDANGNVYAFQRGPKADPIVVFSPDGKYLRSWGKGLFSNPHGIRIDKQGHVWTTDTGFHLVMEFTSDGKLLRTWGAKGKSGAGGILGKRACQYVWARGAGGRWLGVLEAGASSGSSTRRMSVNNRSTRLLLAS